MGNIIDLQKGKSKLEAKKREAAFKNYLKSLKQEELQTEANYLLNSMGNDVDRELLKKSALLMEELAKRVSNENISGSISNFAESIKEKFQDQVIH